MIDSLTIDSPPQRPKIVFIKAIPSIIYNTQGFTVAGNAIYTIAQNLLGSLDNERNPIPKLEETTYTRSRMQIRTSTPEESYQFGQELSAWEGQQKETQGEISNTTNRGENETLGEQSNPEVFLTFSSQWPSTP